MSDESLLVDDVFDAPSTDGLSRIRYRSFHNRFTQDQDLRRTIAWVTGRTIDSLPPERDDLEEDQIDALWQSTWRPVVGGRRIKQIHRPVLRDLFREHTDNLLAMLDEVVPLFALFKKALSRSVTVHGTDFDAQELAKAEIVVLDFFLGPGLTIDQAFEKASQVVEETINAGKNRPRTAPSFLLVSNRPDDIDITKFRKSTELMKSRFRFFSKRSLETTSTQNLANLYDVVAASDRTSTVELLLDDWCLGATSAIQHVRSTILSLDVSDLTYLDCFRLSHEGTSVPNYLKWFLTSLLSANVAPKLSPRAWDRLLQMKFADVFDSSGNLDSESLMATFDGPTDAIAQAYTDIVFDTDRARTPESSAHQPSPWRDLMEGDLFVRPRGRDRKRLEKASVLLVLTPGCDLRVRGGQQSPSAEAVVLLPGVLTPIQTEDGNRNFAEGCYVRVQDRGSTRLMQIDWDYHRPTSLDWQQVASEGPGKGFKRLGRIRELYFHKIREAFIAGLARIGTETPPVYPHALSGEVRIAVQRGGRKRQEPVMSFSRADGCLWEIGPVKGALHKNTRPGYFYQVSRAFVQTLNSTLDACQDDDPPLAQAIKDAKTRLDDLDTFMALVRPMRHGNRGPSDCIEIKQAALRSKAKTTSQAPILIVPFRD